MHSWLDGALTRFDDDNQDAAPRTRALLDRVISDADLHARLINTLSLLEHIGSRKIVATQQGADIDQPTLRHIAEEAHHAYFMKRQAEKAAGRELEYVESELLAAASARMYFQRLEAAMAQALPHAKHDRRTVYLYMSMIVEFRALWFYELYQRRLKAAGHPMSLKRILGEERNHLHEMAGRLAAAGELDDAYAGQFLRYETVLYGRMLDAIERAVYEWQSTATTIASPYLRNSASTS